MDERAGQKEEEGSIEGSEEKKEESCDEEDGCGDDAKNVPVEEQNAAAKDGDESESEETETPKDEPCEEKTCASGKSVKFVTSDDRRDAWYDNETADRAASLSWNTSVTDRNASELSSMFETTENEQAHSAVIVMPREPSQHLDAPVLIPVDCLDKKQKPHSKKQKVQRGKAPSSTTTKGRDNSPSRSTTPGASYVLGSEYFEIEEPKVRNLCSENIQLRSEPVLLQPLEPPSLTRAANVATSIPDHATEHQPARISGRDSFDTASDGESRVNETGPHVLVDSNLVSLSNRTSASPSDRHLTAAVPVPLSPVRPSPASISNNSITDSMMESIMERIDRIPPLTANIRQAGGGWRGWGWARDSLPEAVAEAIPFKPGPPKCCHAKLLTTLSFLAILIVGVLVPSVFLSTRGAGNVREAQDDKTEMSSLEEQTTTTPYPILTKADRYESIKDTLSGSVPTELLDNVFSPQFHAMNWIAKEDGAVISTTNLERLLQRYALAVFYFATSGNGDGVEGSTSWSDQHSFLSSNHECTWHGLDYAGNILGITQCNSDLQVTAIQLPNNGLHGKIPVELAELPHLSVLCLSGNSLYGTVPTEFGRMQHLKVLDLHSNTLTGEVPAELGHLTQLASLHMGQNFLAGSIPTELGLLGEATLGELDLSVNSLTGSVPSEMGQLTALTRLLLFDNDSMSGEIPKEMSNLTNLMVLTWDHGGVTGTLPTGLGQLVHLSSLRLGGNFIQGQIPTEFGLLRRLTTLDLADNGLTGSLPSQLGELEPLKDLQLFHNHNMSGTLPTEVGRLTDLIRLELYGTSVGGPLLPEMGRWTKMQVLRLSENGFSGTLPETLGLLQRLRVLNLQKNQLTGTVPRSFADLVVSARKIYLDGNNLTGEVDFLCKGNDDVDLFVDRERVECSCCTCCNKPLARWH